MKKYDFESIVCRKGTSAYKTDEELIKKIFDLNYYDDTISMWVADMDFACPPKVIDAISTRLDRKIFGYTKESSEYHESIINWYKRRHNMNIENEWLVFSNGTVTSVRNCLRSFTAEGEGIIIQPPIYYPFEREIVDTGRTVLRNNLLKDENNNYSIDFNDFEEKCKDLNTRMFIYCNPHNPTGNIWPAEVTQRLLDICSKNDVLFFSDEIHCDIIRKDSCFVSALNLLNNENAIIATAVNKTFNVAGLHITNLVIKNRELKKKLIKYTGRIGISPFAMEATIAAYNDSEEWAIQMNQVIDENLDYMHELLKKKLPKVKFNKPSGTYLAWLDFNEYRMKEKELLKKIADEGHLILEGGSIFGEPGTGFIRINVACPKSVIVEALDRLVKIFADL